YRFPGQAPYQPGSIPGQAPQLGSPPGTGVQIGIPGAAGQQLGVPVPGAPQEPGPQQPAPYPTQNVPGLPGPYGQPGVPSIGAITITTGGQPQPPATPSPPVYSTQPGTGGAPAAGSSPFPQPGYQPLPSEPQQNPALQLIRDLLTRPRPGGLAGIQQQQQAPTLAGQILGGGVAGVASTAEGEAIMVYNERNKYNEWEFVYDFRKDPLRMGRMGLAPGQPGATTGTQQPGATGPGTTTPGSRRR
ncbi:MAG: hypothetical protein ACP5U2_12910, partial [Bryobacteraceae bacterium]